MTFRDWYAILDVGPGSDDAEILAAYRRQSFRWHPDRNRDRPEIAHEHFLELSMALQELLDPGRRAAFDREWRRQHPDWTGTVHGERHVRDGGMPGFDSLVREAQAARDRRAAARPHSSRREVEIVLTELARLHGAGPRAFRTRHWTLTLLTLLAGLAAAVHVTMSAAISDEGGPAWWWTIVVVALPTSLLLANAVAWWRYERRVAVYRPTAERIVAGRRAAARGSR